MSQGLVVGICPTSDPAAIESALASANIEAAKIKVIRLASAAPQPDDSSELNFIDVAENMESNSLSDDMTKGLGIMGDAGGTGVPMGRGSSLESFSSRSDTPNYLAGLPIASDEIDNYNDAIAAGRSVIAYSGAGDDAQNIATAFRAAGLKNVRIY